jgi:hypothetical protein
MRRTPFVRPKSVNYPTCQACITHNNNEANNATSQNVELYIVHLPIYLS